MISGAEMMVKCLQAENVTITFGYPGAVICPFYDFLEKTEIEHVLVRSEQNGAHEASGFARASGKAGVCIATSGPGATNLITGLATAYMDSIPLVFADGRICDGFAFGGPDAQRELLLGEGVAFKDSAFIPSAFSYPAMPLA